MKHLLAILLLTLSVAHAQEAPASAASAPVGKPCSEMTADSTHVERARCVKDTKCSSLTKDATRVERNRCEKLKK